MNKIYLALLEALWNLIVKFQEPITYKEIETDNSFVVKPASEETISYLFEVKQIVIVRTPSRVFGNSCKYVYEVRKLTFKNNTYVGCEYKRFPEIPPRLFRNTRVPYILALNAYVSIENSKGENK